jgi:protein O-mannosyl-transferase
LVENYLVVLRSIIFGSMSAKKNIAQNTVSSIGKSSAEGIGKRTVFLLILSVCLILYGNTGSNGYSMDDDLVVKDHQLVKMGLKGIPKIFKSRYAKNEKQNYEYRPIVVSTFAIEHQLFGERPGISHLINVLIYAICAWLIFQITGQMFIHHHWAIPLLTTLLFIVHPIHTEVVASLKNRDELLVMIFSLLSLRSFLRYADQPTPKSLISGVVWLVIAGFAKKSALVYIGLIPLSLYFFKGFSGKKLIGSIASLLLGFLIVRLIFLWVAIEHPGERTLQAFENPMFADPVALHDRIPIMAHTTYFLHSENDSSVSLKRLLWV